MAECLASLTSPHISAQGWELARDHAMTAVGTDNQMRIWYSDSAALEGGLLFKCALGSVDLENPVGAPTVRVLEAGPIVSMYCTCSGASSSVESWR